MMMSGFIKAYYRLISTSYKHMFKSLITLNKGELILKRLKYNY
jgi:hypothetical protein